MALLGGVGRDVDVAGDAFDGTVGDQEAVAVAVHVEAADGELAAAGGDGVLAGAQLDEVAARDQARERGFQFLRVVALGAEFADQLFEIGAGVRAAVEMWSSRARSVICRL